MLRPLADKLTPGESWLQVLAPLGLGTVGWQPLAFPGALQLTAAVTHIEKRIRYPENRKPRNVQECPDQGRERSSQIGCFFGQIWFVFFKMMIIRALSNFAARADSTHQPPFLNRCAPTSPPAPHPRTARQVDPEIALSPSRPRRHCSPGISDICIRSFSQHSVFILHLVPARTFSAERRPVR